MSSTTSSNSSLRTEWLIALALAALTLVVFWPATTCEFISYDDTDYLLRESLVQKGLTPASIAWAFTTGHAANWHPLTWLSLMLDYQFYGLTPWGFHLTNVLLHAANAALLFLVLSRMTGALGPSALWRSALVAALFAVHPLRVESVAWVAERKDVLCAFFGFLALAAYTHYARRPGWGRYLLVLVLYALSLMSKAMLVTLPFLLLLLDYWPLGRLWPNWGAASAAGGTIRESATPAEARFPQRSRLFLVFEKLPLLAVAAASCVATLIAQSHGHAVRDLTAFPWDYRLANAAVSYVRYVVKMFRVDTLAVIYPHPGAWPEWLAIVCAAFLVVSVAVVVWRRRTNPWLAVGWFWYLGLLVPVIGLVQVGLQSMADRYSYLPTIGLLILIAWSLPESWFRSPLGRWSLASAAAVLLLVLSYFTRVQISYWLDSQRLFEHALAVTQDNYLAHNELGVVLANDGKPREAIEHYDLAAKINPNDEAIFFNRANAHVNLSQFSLALDDYNRASELEPKIGQIYNGRGVAYLRLGRTAEAIADFNRAIELQPDFADAYNGRGAALKETGQIAAALKDFATAIRLKPDLAAAYINRGGLRATAQGGRLDAIKDFSMAIQLEPASADIYERRGDLYGREGQLDRAAEDLDRSIAIDPQRTSAYATRAIVRFHQKRYDAAWADVKTCRQLGGQFDPAFIKLLSQASGRSE